MHLSSGPTAPFQLKPVSFLTFVVLFAIVHKNHHMMLGGRISLRLGDCVVPFVRTRILKFFNHLPKLSWVPAMHSLLSQGKQTHREAIAVGSIVVLERLSPSELLKKKKIVSQQWAG